MFIITVEFKIKPESIDAFRIAMTRQAEASLKNEQECRQFDVCYDPSDAGHCFLYEKYDTRESFQTHLASDHFQEFESAVGPCIDEKIVNEWNLSVP